MTILQSIAKRFLPCAVRVRGMSTPPLQPCPHSHLISEWACDAKATVQTAVDTITPSPLNLLALTLSRPFQETESLLRRPGIAVPPNYHHIYFPSRSPVEELARDGYELLHNPPKPFERRMWASGRLEFSGTNPLRVGQVAEMTTRCVDVGMKKGSRGTTVFVTAEKEVWNEDGWCLTDTRRLAYMTANGTKLFQEGNAERKILVKEKPAQFSRSLCPSSLLLFRYSALTFNSHLIHYDHLYATSHEGYKGCLVHGPLTSTLLLDLLRDYLPENFFIRSFTYRAISPLYVDQTVELWGNISPDGTSAELWATDEEGGLAMRGTADLCFVEKQR